MKSKHWYDYLWIASIIYLTLGLFNILFAWIGMLCFIIPLVFAFVKGDKTYCNRYCGRGQLLGLLGTKFSLNKNTPKFLFSTWFRYGFLTFFMFMFISMIYLTYKVFTGMPLSQTITILWTFKLPWNWVDTSVATPWVAQFAFGFYSIMLTSTILGLISMIFFRPRTWCVYCPMGTMTQGICKIKHRKEYSNGGKSAGNS